MVAEGALKADVFSALRPEMYVISTAGVSVNHAALIDLTRGLRALITSDSDYHYNEAVYLRLGTLIANLIWRPSSSQIWKHSLDRESSASRLEASNSLSSQYAEGLQSLFIRPLNHPLCTFQRKSAIFLAMSKGKATNNKKADVL